MCNIVEDTVEEEEEQEGEVVDVVTTPIRNST